MAGRLVPPLIVLRVVNVHAVMIPGLNRTKPGYGHRMHTKVRTTVSVAVGSMALIASLMGCGTDAPARSVGTTTQTPAPRLGAAAVCRVGRRAEAARRAARAASQVGRRAVVAQEEAGRDPRWPDR